MTSMVADRRRIARGFGACLLVAAGLCACAEDVVPTDTTGSGGGGGTSEIDSSGCVSPEVDCGGVCVATDSDAKNCGTCGHDCLEGGCLSGKCQPIELTEGLDQPSALALDDSGLFFTRYVSPGTVESLPLEGGKPTP